MQKKELILISVILILTLFRATAQNTVNTLSVDTKTYNFYEQKEWKKLIETGKESLENGIDFYYLQYRMGVAYYELKKYRKAIPFFENLVNETPEDLAAAEYLYYSYLFSGMYEDARLFGRTLPVSLKNKLNINFERHLFNNAGAEFKYYTFNNYEASIESDENLNQKISQSLWYADLNLTTYTKGKFTLFQGFSYIDGKNKIFDLTYSDTAFNENVKQFQYYISGNLFLSKGTNVKAAIHYVNTQLEGINPESSMGQGNGSSGTNQLYYKTSLNGIVGFIKYTKSISNFDFKATIALSYLNSATQILPGIGVNYYPLGNTNLYIGAEFLYQFTNKDTEYTPVPIIKSKVGVRLFKSVWLEPFMLYGKSNNLVDEDAFVVYNSPNTLNYWYGTNLNINLKKNRLLLYFTWQKYSFTNNYFINTIEKQVDYNMETFFGGIKFRF